MIHTVRIPHWHPARVNQLLGGHWAKAARLKKADRLTLFLAFQKTPRATGRRRVSFTITLGPRMRAPDPDAFFKSLLDGLVRCGMLTDDNRQGVELRMPEFDRGPVKATTITLEDLPRLGATKIPGEIKEAE